MEATMERGRLSLLLLLRLKPIPTMALTDTVDFPTEATDALMEATGVLTDSLLTVATDVPTEDMVVTDAAMEATAALTDSLHTVATDVPTEDMVATDVAITARERPRLLLRLRLMLTTITVTDAATEAMEATAAHMEATVATGPMVATAALTVMATESRQQPEHPPHGQPQIAQYELKKYKF